MNKIVPSKDDQPKDRFRIVFLLSFSLGVMHFLPWTFFVTAHDYWMYKFRDTSSEDVDSEHRTELQKDFSPATTIAVYVFALMGFSTSFMLGHKVPLNIQLRATLCGVLILFVFTAIFIEVDTDSWQTGFFALIVLIVGLINFLISMFGMAVMTLLSKFPDENYGSYVVGQGLGGIITSTLQIISLAVGMTTKVSATVYFWLAILMIVLTVLALFLVEKTNKFFNFYYHQKSTKKEARIQSFREFFDTIKTIWPSLANLFFYLIAVDSVHTAITSLVVSEDEGNGAWNDVYFVPVITFLLSAICEYVGRTLAVQTIKLNINGVWLVVFSFVRIFVFVPLVALCNAHPRSNLPVVFPHDYQYIIILTIYTLTNGLALASGMLLITKTIPPEKLENAYHVHLVSAGTLSAILSFLGFVSVQLL